MNLVKRPWASVAVVCSHGESDDGGAVVLPGVFQAQVVLCDQYFVFVYEATPRRFVRTSVPHAVPCRTE